MNFIFELLKSKEDHRNSIYLIEICITKIVIDLNYDSSTRTSIQNKIP